MEHELELNLGMSIKKAKERSSIKMDRLMKESSLLVKYMAKEHLVSQMCFHLQDNSRKG